MGCKHEHKHKTKFLRLLISSVLLIAAILTDKFTNLPLHLLLIIYLVPYIIIGYDILWEMVENVFKGEFLDENFLMGISTIGALSIGFFPGRTPEFAEAVFILIFFQLGEMFENIAVGKSKKAISDLMKIRPETARIERNGKTEDINPRDAAPGETAIVYPGEKIPFDGVITEGESELDVSALTGESVPVHVSANDNVISGSLNICGMLKIRIEKSFEDSTVSKILDLVENSSSDKAKSEKFIRKFAKIYTPAVVISAILIALIPAFYFYGVEGESFLDIFPVWMQRAICFLIISCPCALVVSVPLSFFGGIGRASSAGILIKGGRFMEPLSSAKTFVFDKTGTITKGSFEITEIKSVLYDENRLLQLAAVVESFSNHPIAKSLKKACAPSDEFNVSGVTEIPGKGVKSIVNGEEVLVGTQSFLEDCGIYAGDLVCSNSGTIIHVSEGGNYAGYIVFSDVIKKEVPESMEELKKLGADKLLMLSGDKHYVAKNIASVAGLDGFKAELLPQDKIAALKEIKAGSPTPVVFVGDGINDAPALAYADVGIAMGGLGSDAAIEAADVVIMNDNMTKIPAAIKICRKTLSIAKQNIVFAISVKLAVLLLSAFGYVPMWLAVFADVGVLVIAILNAMRCLKIKI